MHPTYVKLVTQAAPFHHPRNRIQVLLSSALLCNCLTHRHQAPTAPRARPNVCSTVCPGRAVLHAHLVESSRQSRPWQFSCELLSSTTCLHLIICNLPKHNCQCNNKWSLISAARQSDIMSSSSLSSSSLKKSALFSRQVISSHT